jgi:hypothetical protein
MDLKLSFIKNTDNFFYLGILDPVPRKPNIWCIKYKRNTYQNLSEAPEYVGNPIRLKPNKKIGTIILIRITIGIGITWTFPTKLC